MVDELPVIGTLMIAGIGGVQSFIAQARRTQDLWIASQIIQYIARKTYRTALQVPGIMPIYPALDDQGVLPRSVPNRFVLYLPLEIDPNDFGVWLHRQAINFWFELSNDVSHLFYHQLAPNSGREGIWAEQCGQLLNDDQPPHSPFLEFYWATQALHEGNYRADFAKCGRLFASRKLLRDFGDLPPQPGEKCTLNGVLSALSDEPNAERDRVRTFWQDVARNANRKFSQATLRDGERLCAVNTVKRFAQELDDKHPFIQFVGQARFPSTSTVAAAPFKLAVAEVWQITQDRPIQKKYEEFQEVLTSYLPTCDLPAVNPVQNIGYPALQPHTGTWLDDFLAYDGDFIRAEGLTDKAIAEYSGLQERELSSDQRGVSELARETYNKFMETLPRELPVSLSSYYAVVKMDGDHVGEYIAENARSLRDHQDLSWRLAHFASQIAPSVVEDQDGHQVVPGRLIYSGGDDLLAMVPAASALIIANTLRSRFESEVGLNVSAGIVIAHYTQPLEMVLNAARAAEKVYAKDQMGRNAVAVQIMRRSGEIRVAASKWAYSFRDGSTHETLALIDEVRRAFSHTGTLSSQLAYDALEIAEKLVGAGSGRSLTKEERRDLRFKEFRRLVRRRCENTERYDDLAQRLSSLAEEISFEFESDNKINGWEALANWLVIARFLASEGQA